MQLSPKFTKNIVLLIGLTLAPTYQLTGAERTPRYSMPPGLEPLVTRPYQEALSTFKVRPSQIPGAGAGLFTTVEREVYYFIPYLGVIRDQTSCPLVARHPHLFKDVIGVGDLCLAAKANDPFVNPEDMALILNPRFHEPEYVRALSEFAVRYTQKISEFSKAMKTKNSAALVSLEPAHLKGQDRVSFALLVLHPEDKSPILLFGFGAKPDTEVFTPYGAQYWVNHASTLYRLKTGNSVDYLKALIGISGDIFNSLKDKTLAQDFSESVGIPPRSQELLEELGRSPRRPIISRSLAHQTFMSYTGLDKALGLDGLSINVDFAKLDLMNDAFEAITRDRPYSEFMTSGILHPHLKCIDALKEFVRKDWVLITRHGKRLTHDQLDDFLLGQLGEHRIELDRSYLY